MNPKAINYPVPNWEEAKPSDVEENPGNLLAMLEQFELHGCGVIRALFIKHGKVFLDYRPYPYRKDLPFSVYSVSKSITGTAIGLAISEGFLKEEDKLLSFYPEYSPLNMSSLKQQIRIKDLLTMSCGHRYADGGYPGGDPEYDTYPQPGPEKNIVENFLDQPVLHPPGSHFVYNTSGILVLCDLIQKLTGESFSDYLESRLFRKIGISDAYCTENNGGHGFFFSASDLAKVGYLYLNNGKWTDQQILPIDWVTKARSKQAQDADYGYCFWLLSHNLGYMGQGLFGQHLIVLDREDTICVIYTENQAPGPANVLQIVVDHFINGKATANQNDLQDFISRKERAPASTPSQIPPIASKFSNQCYKTDSKFMFSPVELPDLFAKFSIIIGDNSCILKTGEYSLYIGLDDVFAETSFTYKQIPRCVALRGSWIGNEQFKIEFKDLTSTNWYIFSFDFAKMILTLEEKVGWSRFFGIDATCKMDIVSCS